MDIRKILPTVQAAAAAAVLGVTGAAALASPTALPGPGGGAMSAARGEPRAQPRVADPEQELRAIRQALVEKALEGRTRVSATSWINEKGELMEASQFRSDMDVRGVRVTEYVGDEPTVQVDAKELASGATAALAPPVCAPSRRQAHLRHPVRLQVRLSPGQGMEWMGPATQARAAVEQTLQAHAQAMGARLPVLEGVAAGPANAYERAVYGRDEPRQPLDLTVTLTVIDASAGRDARVPALKRWAQDGADWAWAQVAGHHPAVRPAVLRIDLSLARPHEPAVLRFREDLPMTVSDEERPTRRLAAQALQHIRAESERWWLILEDAMACEPVTFEARQQGDRTFRVLAGADAGLRPGDRLVLTDSRRIPRRVLEADSAQHLALLEVDRVEGDRAEARQVAGPALGKDGAWVALPY